MHSTPHLLQTRARFHAFAMDLAARADLLEVECEFATARPTLFRRARARLISRARHLRSQAGEVFARVNRIDAIIEKRQDDERPLKFLSAEGHAAIREAWIEHESMHRSVRDSARSSGTHFANNRARDRAA